MAGHVARVGACSVLMGKPEGKRPIGEPARRWDNNMRADLKNLGGKNLDLIEKSQAFFNRFFFFFFFC